MKRRGRYPVALALACSLLLPACGLGTATVARASGGSSSADAQPVASDFVLERSGKVRFVLSLAANVDIQYRKPTDEEDFASIRLTPASNPLGPVEGSPEPYEVEWDFAMDLGGGGFRDDVELRILLNGGTDPARELIGGQVGNDPPEILELELPVGDPSTDEVVGVADFRVRLADSSSDEVDVTVEYACRDCPDRGPGEFRPATSAAGPFEDLGTQPDPGVNHFFFWDVAADLGRTERTVAVRFTARDADAPSPAVLSTDFRTDNNSEPILFVREGSFLNAGSRGAIPIPFTVTDGEADVVEPVFQWRRQGEPFPPLPGTAAEIRAILADPAARRTFQIATEVPTRHEGTLLPSPSSDPLGVQVRLPELASSAAGLLTSGGLVARRLDILRASHAPELLSGTWTTDPGLTAPAAALPTLDGAAALVLEDLGETWRLREIELATGTVRRVLVESHEGAPDAMTFERDGVDLLVATHDTSTGDWTIYCVSGANSSGTSPVEVAASTGTTVESGPIRGIACWKEGTAIVTLGSSLLRVDYSEGGDSSTSVVLGPPAAPLQRPWGVAVPSHLQPHLAYVAENGAGRVLAVDLERRTTRPIPATGLPLAAPQALALERGGTRLVVVTDDPDPSSPGLELRAVNLGDASDLDGDGLADTETFEIARGFGYPSASLAVDAEACRLLAFRDPADMAAGGGVQQTRTITDYEPTTQVVTVDAPFHSPLFESHGVRRWRIVDTATARASLQGARDVFVWDSRDVSGEVKAFVRAIPVDTEIGTGSETTAGKQLRTDFDGDPLLLQDPTMVGPVFVTPADLDRDGDTDLVTANAGSNNLTIFRQTSPGIYEISPNSPISDPAMDGPLSVVAGDIDGDGALDLVTANGNGGNLSIFLQGPGGGFVLSPAPSDPAMVGPVAVALADFDGNGRTDIISANSGSNNLTVFRQTTSGFLSAPTVLSDNIGAPTTVLVTDLNLDGRPDVVCGDGGASLNGCVTVFLQSEDGDFAFASSLRASTNGRPLSVHATDLNGDGNLDLVTANSTVAPRDPGRISMFFQTSPGVFGPTPVELTEPQIEQPQFVSAADLDSDGDVDLAVIGQPTGVIYQTAPGVFDLPPADVILGSAPVPADLDGDGDTDLVGIQQGRLVLSLQLPGRTSYATTTLVDDPGSRMTLHDVGTADLDTDGDLDVFFSSGVVFQTSVGVFDESRPVFLDDPDATGLVSIAAADIDGDQDVDLVTANSSALGIDRLTIHNQSAPGVFTRNITSLSSESMVGPQEVVIADMNGDGLVDLLTANSGSQNLTVFHQSPSQPGSFADTPEVLCDSIVGLRSVAAADIDGDGRLDVVTASSPVAILLQAPTRPGVFECPPRELPGTTAEFVLPEDVDADGDVDLVVAEGTLTIFLQSDVNPGTFAISPDPPPFTSGGLSTIAAADLDSDGDTDFAVARDAFGVTLFHQVAPAKFGPAYTRTLGFGGDFFKAVAAGDLEGDGDADVISGEIPYLSEFPAQLHLLFQGQPNTSATFR